MKTVKHLNVMHPNPGIDQEGYDYFYFVCRGCTMRNRQSIWEGYCSSMSDPYNKEIDNSYLSLEEEPTNTYDPNAILVVCRGEFFGNMGYVGKEFTGEIKKILEECQTYRVDMVDIKERGQREVHLVLTWKKKDS